MHILPNHINKDINSIDKTESDLVSKNKIKKPKRVKTSLKLDYQLSKNKIIPKSESSIVSYDSEKNVKDITNDKTTSNVLHNLNKIKGFCSIFGNVRSNFSVKNNREKMKILKREYNKNNLNEYVLKESTKTKVLDNFIEPDVLFKRIKNHPLTIKEKRNLKKKNKGVCVSQKLISPKKKMISSLSKTNNYKKAITFINNHQNRIDENRLDFANEVIIKDNTLDSSDEDDLVVSNKYSSLNLNKVLNSPIQNNILSNRSLNKSEHKGRNIKKKETLKNFDNQIKSLKRLNTAKFRTNINENSNINLEKSTISENISKKTLRENKIININGIAHHSINDFKSSFITAYLPSFLNKNNLSLIEKAKINFNKTKKELSDKIYQRVSFIDQNQFLNSLEEELNNEHIKELNNKNNKVIFNDKSEKSNSFSNDGISKIEDQSNKETQLKVNKVKEIKNSFRKGLINNKLKGKTSEFNIDKMNRIKEETHLLSMKSVFQSEAFYFPMAKKDYYRLGKMKNYLQQNISSVNDTFFNSLENKINFINDSRRLPNLKFDLKGNLFNSIVELEVDEYINENIKFQKLINDKKKEVLGSKEDDDILKKQLLKLEHPNVINPECMIQLNLMKRKKQLKMKNENKKSIETISSEKQKLNVFDKTVKEYKMFMKGNIKESSEYSEYFDLKIKDFNNINFEKDRCKETILNLS